MKLSKRFKILGAASFLAGLFLVGAYAGTPSGIQINGTMVDYGTLLQFLNNPTFPGQVVMPGGASISAYPKVKDTNITIPANEALATLSSTSTSGIAVTSNTTDVSGQWMLTDLFIPITRTITKVGFLQGGTATTDNITIGIWNANGQLICNTNIAGTVLSGANTFQEQAIASAVNAAGTNVTSTTCALTGPATYYVGIQGNGTAAGAYQTVVATSPANTFIRGASAVGTFGVAYANVGAASAPASLPTTSGGSGAPVVYVY